MSKSFAIRVTAAALAVAMVAGTAVFAQATKIGLIDTRRLITESNAGREILAGLDKLAEEKSERIKPLQDEVQALQKKIQDGRLSLSEEKLAEMQKQLDDKMTAGRRLREDLQKEMEDAQAQAFSKFEQKLEPLIEKFGKDEGFAFILNTGFFNQPNLPSGIVWADPQVDVTGELIKRLDAAIPASSAPGGTKPSN